MFNKHFPTPMSLPVIAHAFLAACSIAGFVLIKPVLDASYAASLHPVDYATGQLAFNGGTIKGYYAHMKQVGTLDIYWQTQFIDFAFIAAMFCLGIFFFTLVARLSQRGTWGQRIGIIATFAAMAGALSDSIENLISFVMLTSADTFPNWLALAYSGFAAVKFILITTAMVGAIISLILGSFALIFGRKALNRVGT